MWLGNNSLAAYAGDILLQHVLEDCFYWRETSRSARAGIHALLQRAVGPLGCGVAAANNLYAALDVLLWVFAVGVMQRKRVFWKV